MGYWTFWDFVDGGVNQITAWLDELGPVRKDVKIRLDARLTFLAQCQRLSEPQVKVRQGRREHGLLELRFKAAKVEWRPLACYGPGRGQVTILCGAYEKNNRLEPPGVIDTALARMDKIRQEGRITEHVRY